jgi:tetratricopeptide (TPR) repeat protein
MERLNFSAAIGEAWFPIIRSLQEQHIFGLLLSINTHRRGVLLSEVDQESIRSWLSLLLDNTPVEIPQLYLSNLPPDWEIRGSSWGLAAIIAIISSLLQMKPNQHVLCSGVLSSERGYLEPVSAQKEKRILCSWEAPDLIPFIITHRRDIAPLLTKIFVHDWKKKLLQRLKVTPRSLAEEALNQYRQRNSNTAYRMARNVLKMDTTSLIPQILAYFVLGSVDKHTGQSLASVENLTKSRALILQCSEVDQLDFYLRFRLEANLGIAMLHNLQITPAIHIVEQGLRELSTIQSYHRDLNWRSVSLRLAGTLRWLYIANGELQKAVEIQLAWPLSQSRVPQHLCRSLYSLVDVYWRTGELEKAKKTYREAKEAFAEVRPVERPLTQRYLLLAGMKIGEEKPIHKSLVWAKSLVEQLEVLEFSLSTNQLPILLAQRSSPPPKELFTLFFLSGFIARSIMKYGFHPIFSPFLNQLESHQEKMPPRMKDAFVQLQKGDGNTWSKIAPY